MRLLRATGVGLLLLGLAGCVGISSEVPRYRATTDRPGDRVTVEGVGEAVTFNIESERGIGKAEIERVGPPAQSVTFNLRLKGLEEFRLTWDDKSVRLQYPTTGDVILQEQMVAGNAAAAAQPGDEYYMNVRIEGTDQTIPLENGYFVVEAPTAFIEDAPKQFRVEWIDFYR